MDGYSINWDLSILGVQSILTKSKSDSFRVRAGTFEVNQKYKVSVTLQSERFENVKISDSVTFETGSPPSKGTVKITPDIGKLGHFFSITC